MSGGRTLGDFSGLAEDYAKYRPDYSQDVLSAILGMVGKPPGAIAAADIGAGTGIWTAMLAARGLKSVVAVEPNEEMRAEGVRRTSAANVTWQPGSGEHTRLPASSFDLVTMASSFHWTDFDAATREFHRILREDGCFVALWNPRYLEASPLLMEIEQYLKSLKPEVSRVSSGRSGITRDLAERLENCGSFKSIVFLEAKHVLEFTPERYLGAWRSVNDLRVQLGEDLFQRFLTYVQERISHLRSIQATYLTRAWVARRR